MYRRKALKLTAGVGLISVAGSSPVAAYSHGNDDSSNGDADVNYTPDVGSVSFTSPEDGVTKQNPITFEMEATNFTIEPADNGVSNGAGHFHILVDQSPVSPGEVIPNNEQNGYYHYGGGQTTAEIDFDPGEHTVRLQAGDANHRAYDLTDSVNLTVEESVNSEQSTLTMNNIGASAWEVSSSNETYVDVSGSENPTITLETGVRYTINNEGWSTHPLAFRDENGNRLLSQEPNDAGSFEDTAAINWDDSGGTLSFTLTEELAGQMSSYICTVHSSAMKGSIETIESGDSPYVNSDNVVNDEGLNTAVSDYLRGNLSDSRINDIIASYLSGTPISSM